MNGTRVCRISRLPFIEGEKIAVFILRGVPFPYEDGDHWERLVVCPPIFGKYDSKKFIKDIYPDSFTLNILKRAFAIEENDEEKFGYDEVADAINDIDLSPGGGWCRYTLDVNYTYWGDWGDELSVFAIKKEVYNKIISIYEESSIYEEDIKNLKQHIYEDFYSDHKKDEDEAWFEGYPDWIYRVSSENFIYSEEREVLIDKQLLENRLIQGYKFEASLELLRTSFDPGTNPTFDWVDYSVYYESGAKFNDEDKKKYELEIYRAIYKFNNFIASLSIKEYSKYKNISLEEAEKLIINNDNQDGQDDSK